MCSKKRSWISFCYISIPLGLVIFLCMLYKFLPSVFSLLLNCTPVVVFSTLLLGILLSHGEPNIPDNEDYNDHDRKSYLNTCSASNDHGIKNEKRFTHKSHVGGCRRPTKRVVARTITLGNVRRRSAASKGGEENEANHIDATSASSSSSLEEDDAKNNLEQAEDLLEVGKDIDNDVPVFDVDDDDNSKLDHHYDSCLGSPHQIDHKDASSGSESDSLASSSPSVANPMPLLDELDPLVPEEHSADGSAVFSDNQASDEDSGEEEVDNQDDEDDEEAREEEEEKEDGNKVAITWTADDQRNLVELGNSELERNRWLETLLAKRKAKKILEKNLIDLDDDMEETRQAHAQLPSINAPRTNPFDLPYDSEEVPGSAPSVLLPRQNPFDLPLEVVDAEENQDHKEFALVPQRDMFIRRHESFSVGSIFEIKQDRRTSSRFKSYFGAEKTESEEIFHGEISEVSDSKLSSTLESDDSHIKHNAEPVEQYSQTVEHIKSVDVERVENQMSRSNNHTTDSSNSHQNTETEDDSSVDTMLHSPASNVERARVIDEEYESSCSNPSDNPKISTPERTAKAEETNDSHAEQYSQTVEHIKSVDVERVENQMSRSNNHATDSSNSHQNTETEDDSSVDTMLHSPASNVERARVIDEEYESSCSNPSDNPKISTPERTAKAEETNDSHVVEPVYDSSPTATDKSHSNSTLDEPLHVSDKGGGSPRLTTERSIESDGGTEESQQAANEIPWVAHSSLAFVEHTESVPKEVSIVKDHDVIGGDELSKVHEDFGSPVLSVLPESEDRNSSNLPPEKNEPGKDS